MTTTTEYQIGARVYFWAYREPSREGAVAVHGTVTARADGGGHGAVYEITTDDGRTIVRDRVGLRPEGYDATAGVDAEAVARGWYVEDASWGEWTLYATVMLPEGFKVGEGSTREEAERNAPEDVRTARLDLARLSPVGASR